MTMIILNSEEHLFLSSLPPLRITKNEKEKKDLLANILVVELPLETLTSLLLFFNLDDCFILRYLSVCVFLKSINRFGSFHTVTAIQGKGVQRTRAPTDIDS